MRSYLESHPWITFKATEFNDLGPATWMLLGEARSKCEHLAGVPLRPDVARRLYDVALVKGAQATTAIEGNTLTEEQVAGILDGTFSAPPSRAYQEREVRNVLDALQEIARQVMGSDSPSPSEPSFRLWQTATTQPDRGPFGRSGEPRPLPLVR